ncbi:hypothetical protein D3C87_1562300 [compost metagenome]
MRAIGDHDEPLLMARLGPLFVGRRVLQVAQRHRLGFLDLGRRAVTHEHRQTAPGDGHRLTFRDRADIKLDAGQRQRRGIGVHLVDQRPDRGGGANACDSAGCDKDEIPPRR